MSLVNSAIHKVKTVLIFINDQPVLSMNDRAVQQEVAGLIFKMRHSTYTEEGVINVLPTPEYRYHYSCTVCLNSVINVFGVLVNNYNQVSLPMLER